MTTNKAPSEQAVLVTASITALASVHALVGETEAPGPLSGGKLSADRFIQVAAVLLKKARA